MKPQPELPEPGLREAVEAILPEPLSEMADEEIVQYVDDHFEALKEELRMQGFYPEVYVPPPPEDVNSKATSRKMALEYLASTGPMWTPPSDHTNG